MRKFLTIPLLFIAAAAWAGCGVERAPLKKVTFTSAGETAVLTCAGRQGEVYLQGSDLFAACHTDKKHAKWVAYKLGDGSAAKGNDCRVIRDKGWACTAWRKAEQMDIEARGGQSGFRCNDSDYDESSLAK